MNFESNWGSPFLENDKENPLTNEAVRESVFNILDHRRSSRNERVGVMQNLDKGVERLVESLDKKLANSDSRRKVSEKLKEVVGGDYIGTIIMHGGGVQTLRLPGKDGSNYGGVMLGGGEVRGSKITKVKTTEGRDISMMETGAQLRAVG